MENETVTPMNTLLEDIRNASGVDEMKAEQALGAVLEFFSARLPSPVMGRIREALSQNKKQSGLGNSFE